MTLTQGHRCDIDKQKFGCLQDKVRTTQPISAKLCSYISLVMIITWLTFGGIPSETHFLPNFLWNFECVFSSLNTSLVISQECLVRIMWNEKEVHRMDAGWTAWPLPLTSPMTLTSDFSRSNFKIAVSEELLSDWRETKSKSLRYWADYMVLPFDHNQYPWPGSLKVKVWKSLIWAMGWRHCLTWKERGVSRSFMNMTVTWW